ncbi:MAG: cation-transporting P-type ATPase [Candidatus Thalassarchaeaceae archaeon]|nr:cation-transporting P-type ATPase [Candidatus Thalassarchaeaceae archaeon]
MPSSISEADFDSSSSEPLWHNLQIDEIFDELNTSTHGLSTDEVGVRVEKYGFNKLKGKVPRHPLLKLIDQFRDPMVYLLMIAATITFLIDRKDLGTPIFIVIALSLNAIFSYIQERKAEEAMDSLKKLLVSHCIVLRDGMEHRLSTEELVPGDIVWLEDGLNVPADIRLLEVHQLAIDESSLTGESDVVYKELEVCSRNSILQEMTNIAFMGTVVSSGRGLGVVIKTGMTTKLGDIASGLSEVDTPKTPLEIKLESLGRYLGFIAVISAVALVGFNIIIAFIDGTDMAGLKVVVAEQFLIAVAIFVAIVPEGLPIILVITLALGMQNMSAKNAIISRMKVVETLGSSTIICTDKTGTLTRNEMSVRSFYCGDEIYTVSGSGFNPNYGVLKIDDEEISESQMATLKVDKGFKLATACTLLCQNSSIREHENNWKAIGNPTDSACAVFGWKMMESVDTFRKKHPRFKEFTFDRIRKRMTTIHEYDGERWVFSKGAIGPYLSRISHVVENGRITPISDKHRNNIGKVNLEMATRALRVIALTARPLSGEENMEDVDSVESGLIFLGLVGIMDPPRAKVTDAISKCHDAGVQVMMITGDQQMTAMAIGKEIGIIQDDSQFVTGKQLHDLTDEELDERIDKIVMFSRVTPDQKLRIVTRLQKAGHVVAMTGDGDNDAPALSQANIGIAMGVAGTDVARDAADMVLKDDNFSTIVDSIEEGRKIYLNIRNFVRYQISTNVAAVLLIIIATFIMGWKLPMTATQLLVINILMDGPPALALGIEKRHGDVMDEPPRALREPLPNRSDKRLIGYLGLVMAIGTLAIFSLAGGGLLTGDSCHGVTPESSPDLFDSQGDCDEVAWDDYSKGKFDHARTVAFAAFIMFQLFNVVNCRSIDKSVFELGLFRNMFISASFVISLFSLVLIVQNSNAMVPLLGITFGSFLSTIPLKLSDWVMVFIVASGVFWIEEFRKIMFKISQKKI